MAIRLKHRAELPPAWTGGRRKRDSFPIASFLNCLVGERHERPFRLPFGPRLSRGATVYVEDLTGDPVGSVGGQEQCRAGDVDGLGDPA
jgi:hypothetical protein